MLIGCLEVLEVFNGSLRGVNWLFSCYLLGDVCTAHVLPTGGALRGEEIAGNNGAVCIALPESARFNIEEAGAGNRIHVQHS